MMTETVKNLVIGNLPQEYLDEISIDRLDFLLHHYEVLTHKDETLDNVSTINTKSDSFASYAAMHLASIKMEELENSLLENAVILSNPKYFLLAKVAFDMLFCLYQELGADVLGGDEKNDQDETK
tara:strand:- start:146 stop:520 length:375 start_codon:yes stop_codon:yes gene_type:complete